MGPSHACTRQMQFAYIRFIVPCTNNFCRVWRSATARRFGRCTTVSLVKNPSSTTKKKTEARKKMHSILWPTSLTSKRQVDHGTPSTTGGFNLPSVEALGSACWGLDAEHVHWSILQVQLLDRAFIGLMHDDIDIQISCGMILLFVNMLFQGMYNIPLVFRKFIHLFSQLSTLVSNVVCKKSNGEKIHASCGRTAI